MKVKYQLKLFYFQVDKALMSTKIVSTVHIMVIIYQSVNVNICWKIQTTSQLKTYFSSTFYT
jgi:hypothetical protein